MSTALMPSREQVESVVRNILRKHATVPSACKRPRARCGRATQAGGEHLGAALPFDSSGRGCFVWAGVSVDGDATALPGHRLRLERDGGRGRPEAADDSGRSGYSGRAGSSARSSWRSRMRSAWESTCRCGSPATSKARPGASDRPQGKPGAFAGGDPSGTARPHGHGRRGVLRRQAPGPDEHERRGPVSDRRSRACWCAPTPTGSWRFISTRMKPIVVTCRMQAG